MEEVGEQEADELEGRRDHAVPDEAENGADREAIDVDLIWAAETGGKYGGFPIRWYGIGCGLFIGLIKLVECSFRLGGLR